MNIKDIKIVFFGTPEFAVASLERLLADGCQICAVVTAPDKAAGRGHKLLQSDVKKCALAHGIPVLQPANLKDTGFQAHLRSFEADLFIVIAFRMLPESVWAMPPMGTFNLHGSLLPAYRGAAPINRAVMHGDRETGVTTFFLQHEIDTGRILRQERLEIGPDENVGSVHDRMMELGAEVVSATVRDIAVGTISPIEQDDSKASAAPKIFRDDCRIDWTRSAREVHNHIRGLSPYPCAWSVLAIEGGSEIEVKIPAACISSDRASAPAGSIIVEADRMIVGCGEGCVEILELKPAGKRAMDAASFLRGYSPLRFLPPTV